jgi:hypothetical protein
VYCSPAVGLTESKSYVTVLFHGIESVWIIELVWIRKETVVDYKDYEGKSQKALHNIKYSDRDSNEELLQYKCYHYMLLSGVTQAAALLTCNREV